MKCAEKRRKVNLKEHNFSKQVTGLQDKAAADEATESQKVSLSLWIPT